MKQSSIILLMIILGEKALGMDIDVYLQPLIKELVQLWQGVGAYDAYTNTRFTLWGALHYTTKDFPAYANTFGWSMKGRFTWPSYGKTTQSLWLENGHKFYHMGHWRWLVEDHPFQYDRDGFDGNMEFDNTQASLTGS